ncbi:hypothetical protein DOM21_16440 [Bacteriovorax stolpii]|uniref:esterase-like activity of phytase family protein n=1 Tax=Bacteriovorax stolpii TaxID=960 RepID=UPI001158E21E|nr:esterase-like activity of phytase family protein [Bacteriovorax stolpii]QDK43013.1 hypothetical protein DOM21_16440 [Bacteriovorax stolpii]
MTKTVRTLLAFFLITTLNYSYAADKLRFIGDVTFPTGEMFAKTEIGGLSGIAYDKNKKRMLAVSDDKSLVNETRFYEFDISLTEKSFSVKPAVVVRLKNKAGNFFKKGEADFEGIALYGNDVLISSEGAINRTKPTPPELYRFNRMGDFVGMISIPEKFLLPRKEHTDKLYGSRDNHSFEALSTSLDGKTTYMGSEEALFQDGPITTISYSSHTRIILYKDLKPTTEIAYQLDKVEAIKAAVGTEKSEEKADLTTGENGLVDIAAVDDKTFYTMERSWIPFINKNVIRIFKCTVTDKTTDISKMESLKDQSFVAVEKELVADLDDFIPQMTIKELDNIEGIAFGPVLANGNRSLVVVSDNNFGKTQRTLFMAFELISSK